jgi:ppGpp synthetase/RelA/SpoT-type nucleotidyltranferase
MPPKRQQAWAELNHKMKAKRAKANNDPQRGKKTGSAPHELIVQRLASEPDDKQTYKAVQPKEFVTYECSTLSPSSKLTRRACNK